MSESSLEDLGFSAMQKKTAPKSDVDEARLLGDLGAFGLNTFVVGLGAVVLSRHREAGVDIMKLGALLAVAGFGAQTLSTSELPKLGS